MHSFLKHPDYSKVLKIYQVLNASGFKTWLVGGCVRDGLMGRVPKDFDLVTEALPTEIDKLFSKTLSVGKEFLISMIVEGDTTIEVATFRGEEVFEDGRKPKRVFAATPEVDASRRDFAMNALFYDIDKNQVIDFVGGQADIESQVIRAIGDPKQRFLEDHLRILRALRFVSELGFQIENSTWSEVKRQSGSLKKISAERVRTEFERLLRGPHQRDALRLVEEAHVVSNLFKDFKLDKSWRASEFKTTVENSLPDWDEEVKLWSEAHPSLRFWAEFLQSLHLTDSNFRKVWQDSFKFSKIEMSFFNELLDFNSVSPATEFPKGRLLSELKGPASRAAFYLSTSLGRDLGKDVFKSLEIWRGQIPAPWIEAKDLISQCQGQALGLRLRDCYWAQLEGVVSTPEAALAFAKSRA